jgi:hypothetical protein
MPSITTFTITAKTGPAAQLTATVFTDVTAYQINVANQTIVVNRSSIPNPEIFDLTGVTTITDTITSTNHAVVVS